MKTAWLCVVLLMPVALLNYLDRQMMASMQSSVMESIPEFSSSTEPQAMWGFMLGQFKWVYAGFSLLGGAVADRISRRGTICGSLFVWSAVTWWTGQVTSYNELLWTRSLMGISEAFYMPAALAMIADYHVGTTRSRAIGMHQMAIYGGVIAGGFGGYAATHLGWRSAFSACGVTGMLYTIPLLWQLRDASPQSIRLSTNTAPPSPSTSQSQNASTPNANHPGTLAGESAASQQPNDGLLQSLQSLLLDRSFLLLVMYFTFPAMAAWVVRDWMPSILKKEFGMGQGAAGVAATLYWQIAAIVGAFAGGWLADRWMQSTIRGRIYVGAIGVTMIVPAIFGVGNATNVAMAVSFLILFGLGWGFFDCNNMPILSQITKPNQRATGYGIMNFVSISCGGLTDWGFGRLQDAKIPLNMSFGLFAFLAVVSIGLVLCIKPRLQDC